eukprot:TRINITY_DN75075_c0_g1_i1.p1 TRINITY_DN75075_c0_g1~~TRINITY_DN75075_c0_g1_i1.p1  ORF type:complete len:354 (-),score=54.95 TRINITY_DN75075_c0_g1_i1:95-1156(-)
MMRFDEQICLPTLSEADYVHDIVYDHYGTKLALCTSSLRISIFGLSSESEGADAGSKWTEIARMDRAHSGPIWRLSWGHPEHGNPLASCSEDRTVTIWCGGQNSDATAAKADAPLPRWQERAPGLPCDGPVVDVRFAPAALGLKFAACTADGQARVFECANALDLRSWESEDLDNFTSEPISQASAMSSMSAALDWKQVPLAAPAEEQAEVIALGGRGCLAIWAKDKGSRWREKASMEAHPVAKGGIKDVAWCLNLCRPYEVVATCGAGAALWRVDILLPEGGKASGGCVSCTLQCLKELFPPGHEACPVWRCSWNLTGTTLALCPEGGEVSIWKADASLDWRPECEIELGGS